MRPKFNYIELEQKYEITVDFPRKSKGVYRNRCMIRMRNVYAKIREKTKSIIPLTQMEEIYLNDRR